MSRIEESVEVNAPLPEVYAQWNRFEEFPRFMRGVVSARRSGPGASNWVVDTAGGRREFEAHAVEVEADRRVAWSSGAGASRETGVVTFHRIDQSTTRLMLQLDIESHGLRERVAEALGFVDRRVIDDLHDFKKHVEAHRDTAA